MKSKQKKQKTANIIQLLQKSIGYNNGN